MIMEKRRGAENFLKKGKEKKGANKCKKTLKNIFKKYYLKFKI